MKKHGLTKGLSLLLVLCLMLSLLPMSALAAETEATDAVVEETAEDKTVEENKTADTVEDKAGDDSFGLLDWLIGDWELEPAELEAGTEETSTIRDTSKDAFYKIVHLDCGRKYFTKDWIIALLYEMKADGYNQLQLAFGNDGLRFLLDDMSFTANGTKYTHSDIVSAVEDGNKAQNSSGDSRWLTESEMDAIIAAANSLGIEIVPLLNLPGHANAILDIAGDAYNADGSDNTVDVTNSEAVNFAMAIFHKYVDYFASKGCEFFNFGADEYANDAAGSFSFSRLNNTEYQQFVDFINDMAAYIESKNMTPRAFNDGLYYDGKTNTIDTAIQCCYWSSGWSSYPVAAASTIADKKHEMINTNGDYYYVLGKNDVYTQGESTTHDPSLYTAADSFSNTTFMGSTISDPAGSMFCIWCDFPNAETETEIAKNTRLILRAMAARMEGNTVSTIDTASVVANGFKADGTINNGSCGTGTAADPYDVTTAEGQAAVAKLTVGNSVYVTTGATVTWSSSNDAVISITSADALSLAAAEVQAKTVQLTAGEMGNATITAGDTEFDVTVLSDELEEKSITVTVGQTNTATISGANYAGTYTTEAPSIATVEVTGTDATEATTTYTQASVTCNTLISSNSKNWTAVSGYYYKADDGNYYPVYAKRSSKTKGIIVQYTEYTYTWGYLADDGSEPTQIGATQTTGSRFEDGRYATPSITVYQATPGEGTPASTTVTFTGVAKGTTYVTIGNVHYTIKVVEEDLSKVTPLSIEYWITNGRPTDESGNNACSVKAENAYSEGGVLVSSLVPVNTSKESRTLQYWRARLLDKTSSNSSTSGTEEQTETSGDDETYNGVAFTKVRYYNSTWAVYTENKEWVIIASNHQLVAYYLEILPVADELTVTAADWGKKGDGSTSGDYLEPSSSCSISVQVVYEDGTTNPTSTTAADLRSKTIAYGYWTSGRGIGTLNLVGLEGYQIWKVEAETGSLTYKSSSSTWGSYTIDSFTWDNNAMTVYEGDPIDTYTLHNDSNNPSKSGYYANLMWDENYEAILITVYVKAKPVDTALTVIYFDEKFSDELYRYSINVEKDVNFDDITPTPSAFSGNASRIDVAGCGITNTLGVTQKFQTDLTKVPEAIGKYDSSLYTYKGSVISEDKTTLYLYYSIDTSVLKPMFVADFGLPITFGLDAVANASATVKSVTVEEKTRYGTLSYDASKKTFTYTPTQVLPNVDVLTINILFDGQSTATTTNSGVLPATTVFYDASFVNGGYYTGNKTQEAAAAGDTQLPSNAASHYGYDAAYASGNDASVAITNKASETDDFSFTGTGIDVYANCTTESGRVYAYLYQDGTLKKLISVETAMRIGETAETGNGSGGSESETVVNQADDSYNTPIISLRGLAYGSYTIKLQEVKSKINASYHDVNISGFRVYDTMGTSANTTYAKDNEDSPVYGEVRDAVLGSVGASNDNNYANQIAKNIMSQIHATGSEAIGAIVISDGSKVSGNEAQDLLNNGPKNELYLAPGQAVVFSVTGYSNVQVGLKAVGIDKVACTCKVNDKNAWTKDVSNVEMFYKVNAGAITITNSGSGLLSVTLVKACGPTTSGTAQATSLQFSALTEEDLVPALLSLGFEAEEEAPEEVPVTPVKPAKPSQDFNKLYNKIEKILKRFFG